MVRFVIFIALCALHLFPEGVQAEKIRGHFNRLPLMKEQALKDDNARAVKNIDYIWETPNGEYFEVDNDNLPLESIVYKLDKTRQSKPLAERKDEDVLIYYFHRVDKYADRYYQVVSAIVSRQVKPNQGRSYLIKLSMDFPGFSATDRAVGAASLVVGDAYTAVDSANKAVSANRNDPKALWLLSVCEYTRGNMDASFKHYKDAVDLDPMVTGTFWEKEYIMEEEPEVYNEWLTFMGKRKQNNGER